MINKKTTIILSVCIGILALVCAVLFFVTLHNNKQQLQLETIAASVPVANGMFQGRALEIGTTTIFIEVADTEPEREHGLSGRTSLGENSGLLFVFDKPGIYSFWMKDMNFAIDMLWLDENFKVVGIKDSVGPETYPDSFTSNAPAKYVLELSAGFAKAHNIKEGSQFSVIK